ncbi:MAG: hypothetical protein LBQ48_07845 [Oscillospiraceae bacterium]|jgi:hypothetical protein|nr:hypothetical protein [Oscillospiraceae bacterium]
MITLSPIEFNKKPKWLSRLEKAYNAEITVMCASENGQALGYALFCVDGEICKVLLLAGTDGNPLEDYELADGLLRACLNTARRQGCDRAVCVKDYGLSDPPAEGEFDIEDYLWGGSCAI